MAKRIIIINDSNNEITQKIKNIIQREDAYLVNIKGKSESLDVIKELKPDLIFLIIFHPDSKENLVYRFKQQSPNTPIIVCTNGTEDILALLKQGADDFVMPDTKEAEIIVRIENILNKPPLNAIDEAKGNLIQELGLREFIGKSPQFLGIIEAIPKVAKCDVTVLITGETGTGKELCARAIHYLSKRRRFPFIPVDCGAIPLQLFESELFGHEKGAFTDAKERKVGLIAEAEGGTIFIDEVEILSLRSQVKLLRFLQEKTYRSLGNTKSVKANVRIIAASNKDLREKITRGRFREDLFYRLNIIHLELPPLRERKGDIPLLANYFLRKYACKIGKKVGFSEMALGKLCSYEFPGNIRELENIVQRAMIMSKGDIIQSEDIHIPIIRKSSSLKIFKEAKAEAIRKFEKNYIIQLLRIHHGNITHAAKAAGKERSAFGKLVRKYNIDTTHYKHKRIC